MLADSPLSHPFPCVIPLSIVPFSLCASAWVCGHSVATSLPVVWTYSLSVLSRCLFTCCSTDQTPSPPWCDSPATLMNGSAQRPSAAVKCPLAPHQSQKRTVRLAQPWIPTVSSDHGSAEASEEIKGENIRQKEEQRSNRAWWKGAAWGLGLMSLTSPHGLQGRTPLKWVNFAPVITAQIQQSQISLSISHQRIESLRESWLTEDIVLKWAVSLSLSLPSAHQTLSVTFPDGLCNAETEQLWQENIRNVSVILQDNQKRQKRWKIGKDRFR